MSQSTESKGYFRQHKPHITAAIKEVAAAGVVVSGLVTAVKTGLPLDQEIIVGAAAYSLDKNARRTWKNRRVTSTEPAAIDAPQGDELSGGGEVATVYASPKGWIKTVRKKYLLVQLMLWEFLGYLLLLLILLMLETLLKLYYYIKQLNVEMKILIKLLYHLNRRGGHFRKSWSQVE